MPRYDANASFALELQFLGLVLLFIANWEGSYPIVSS